MAGLEDAVIEWHPALLVRDAQSRSRLGRGQAAGFALIVLNQPLGPHFGLIRRLWDNAFVRVAADGGANCLYEAAGKHGDGSFDDLRAIIGDLDSLTSEARTYYETRPAPASPAREPATEVIRDPDQESTDFAKAVQYVRERWSAGAEGSSGRAVDIVAVGGLGGRVDQGLSQLHHLYLFQRHPRYADGRLYLFSGESLTFLLKAGRHRIRVRDDGDGDGPGSASAAPEDVFGKYVGIVPVGGPSRITTRGLEWDVMDWETEFGGRVSTSNHVLPETRVVEVSTTADVLFTIALRQA